MVSDTVTVSGFMFLRVVVDVLVTLTQRPFTILDLFDLAILWLVLLVGQFVGFERFLA